MVAWCHERVGGATVLVTFIRVHLRSLLCCSLGDATALVTFICVLCILRTQISRSIFNFTYYSNNNNNNLTDQYTTSHTRQPSFRCLAFGGHLLRRRSAEITVHPRRLRSVQSVGRQVGAILLYCNHYSIAFITLLQSLLYCNHYSIAFITLSHSLLYCNHYSIAFITLLQSLLYCNHYSIAIITLLQSLLYCNHYSIAIIALLQSLLYCNHYSIAIILFCNHYSIAIITLLPLFYSLFNHAHFYQS
jgi:hypothetical protein